METTTGYTITPCGAFISPGIDTRLKGPTVFSIPVCSERHWQSGVKKLPKFRSGASTTELTRPTRDAQSLMLRPSFYT